MLIPVRSVEIWSLQFAWALRAPHNLFPTTFHGERRELREKYELAIQPTKDRTSSYPFPGSPGAEPSSVAREPARNADILISVALPEADPP